MPTETSGARLLDGQATARQIREEVARGCDELNASAGVVPGLTVVLVGEDPASQIYVRNKERAARKAGMRSDVLRLPAATTEDDLLGLVRRLNADPAVHGILVQLPLPKHINEEAVINSIVAEKDVDGFHLSNVARFPGTGVAPFGELRRLYASHHGRRGQ